MASRFVRHQVFRSPLTGRIYYVAKAQVLGVREDGTASLLVSGEKIDITEQVESLFAKIAKPKRRATKKKKKVTNGR